MFRILIIDPNIQFRKSLTKIINDRFPDMEIVEVSTGDDGLRSLDSFTPLLVFIDIYLPDQNGLDVAKG